MIMKFRPGQVTFCKFFTIFVFFSLKILGFKIYSITCIRDKCYTYLDVPDMKVC